MSEEIIRLALTFYGDVQGVGFRYRAEYAAAAFGVTGFVENLPDDTVFMEAQGTEEAIRRMIDRISAGTFVDIRDIRKKRIPVESGEYGFRVRGY